MLRRRGSIRLWQTELFIVVIVVAIFILSVSLTAGLRATLTEMSETSELRNASALARQVEPEMPVTVDKLDRVRSIVEQYRGIYGSGIWVYDADGTLLVSAYDAAPSDAVLGEARDSGLGDKEPYTSVDMQPGGRVIAAEPLHGPNGSRAGVVVTASPVNDALDVLQAVRERLWVTFWVSLVLAGLIGFAFSSMISRRTRAITHAAAAIADGDFDQRLRPGWVPDEIVDLAESYNRMAGRLGEAFGELQESRRAIAAVVDSMAEGLVGLDASGGIRVINPEALFLLGMGGRGDVRGSTLDGIVEDGAVLDVVREALAGKTVSRTLPLGPHMVLLHCTPVLRPDGGLDGAVLVLSDVTERHRVEEAQRRFVADASHEMRTPITAFKGILELLADGAKDDVAVRDDFMSILQAEADRLARLVTDLLTLARLEGGAEFELTPQWASDMLGEVSRVMGTLAKEAGVILSVEVPEGDARVMADHDRIVQVLLGFTDNALKHSPQGSTIRLRAERNGQGVVLSVSDQGEGIPGDDLDRVFERFYRSDTARVRGGGTGLGLAIAKEIVEAHSSTIRVESTPGTGTTFSFELAAA